MISKLIHKLTGRLHWYEVKINFIKAEITIANTRRQIGLQERNKILNRRHICKMVGDGFEIHKDNTLKGCRLQYEVISYIGWIKFEQ